MNTWINDKHALHRPIIVLAMVVMIICLLIVLTARYKSNQTTMLSNAQADYKLAQEALQLSKQAQQDIKQYLPKYQHLVALGFIGGEHRHEWLARLHQVSTHYQLFTVDYKIGQQAIYHPRLMSNFGQYEMYRSAMTLKWGLLHEEDFIHLLSGLRENTSPFMVRDCEIVTASDALVDSQTMQARLIANCTIDWLTMQDSALKGNF